MNPLEINEFPETLHPIFDCIFDCKDACKKECCKKYKKGKRQCKRCPKPPQL